VTIGSRPPNPKEGDAWTNYDTDVTYVFHNGEWCRAVVDVFSAERRLAKMRRAVEGE